MDEQNLEGKHSKQEEESHRSKGDDGELYEVDDGEDEKQRVLKLPDKRIEAESRSTQSGTIAASSSSQLEESDLHSDLDVSSNLLSEVPVQYTLQPLESAEFKDKFVVANPRRHTPTHLQSPKHPTPIELSPTSVTQSVSSAPSPILPENKLSAASNYSSICVEKVYNQGFSPSTDGYNWRKYGQKLVKSPQGSRSYYRCTHSECCAKKIECCDHSNRLIEVIYRSRHSHDPPKKLNHLKQQCRVTNISTSSKEQGQEMAPMPEKEQANSDLFVKKDESLDEPEPKRRVTVKKISSPYSVSVLKSGKKPKFVVHAAGDVGVSGDGYRWRKYGQKMVSGNPNPRNYYRCTSAGCLVRKHVERAVDNTTAVIITYKGIHDHDMPVPKKRHGPPSAPLIAATASLTSTTAAATAPPRAATTTVLTTQWSVDKKGELTREELDIGEEKAMESAKTLLSIGFEIKPC